MPETIPELLARWRRGRDPSTAIALCDALALAPDTAVTVEVGPAAVAAFGTDAAVLVAAARAFLAAERFAESQSALVAAGKVAPREPAVFRLLGEVLLRRGDAERAEKVLERAVVLSAGDPDARAWLDRAQMFKPMQGRAGTVTVAKEVASTFPLAGARPPSDSSGEIDTLVKPLTPELQQQLRQAKTAREAREVAARIAAAPAPQEPDEAAMTAPVAALRRDDPVIPPLNARGASSPRRVATQPGAGPSRDGGVGLAEAVPRKLPGAPPPPGPSSPPRLRARASEDSEPPVQTRDYADRPDLPITPESQPRQPVSREAAARELAEREAAREMARELARREASRPPPAYREGASSEPGGASPRALAPRMASQPPPPPARGVSTHAVSTAGEPARRSRVSDELSLPSVVVADFLKDANGVPLPTAPSLPEGMLASSPGFAAQAQPFAAGLSERPLAPEGPEAPAAGGVPAPQAVLEALALAGVFEPPGPLVAPTTWDKPTGAPKRRGTLSLSLLLGLFVAGACGAFFGVRQTRVKHHAEAEGLLAQVEATLNEAVPAAVNATDASFNTIFDKDSRSPRAALAWLRQRAEKGLLQGGGDIAFESAIARAEEVGVPQDKLAFARLASFLFTGDTAGAAALLPKWDPAAANDGWYQLLAGATLERAGDARAGERYAAAVKLAPELFVAQVALARWTLLGGDVGHGGELAADVRKAHPQRAEGEALVALAWAQRTSRGEAPPEVEATEKRGAELPISLAFVPHTLAAVRALTAHETDAAKAALDKALRLADGPATATWVGELALDTGDEALARRSALAALAYSAVYTPARALAARVALLGERIEEAVKATEELDAALPDVAAVRAAAAYERLDVDGLERSLVAVPEDAQTAPVLAGVVLARDVLLGRAGPKLAKALEAAGSDAPWADLVAMDLALDVGDIAAARGLAKRWPEGDLRASRAVRLARLARAEGNLEAAEAASIAALAATQPSARAVIERAFVLVARGKAPEVGPLLAKYPALLGPTASWLGAFAAASAGKADEARGKISTLEVFPPQAPLPARVVVASALGAVHDRRHGIDYVKALLASGIESPDVAAAAENLGFKRSKR